MINKNTALVYFVSYYVLWHSHFFEQPFNNTIICCDEVLIFHKHIIFKVLLWQLCMLKCAEPCNKQVLTTTGSWIRAVQRGTDDQIAKINFMLDSTPCWILINLPFKELQTTFQGCQQVSKSLQQREQGSELVFYHFLLKITSIHVSRKLVTYC